MSDSKDYNLPKNVGHMGGALGGSSQDFATRVCCAIAQSCPHIKDIGKVNNSIVATNSNGDVVFSCPLPSTMIHYEPATCTIVYIDTQGEEAVINLSDVLNKLQDSLSFSAIDCMLSYRGAAPGSEIETFDLSVILDKLKNRLVWDADACALVLTCSDGSTKEWSLTSILQKVMTPEFAAQLGADCVLDLTYNNTTSSIDLTPLLDKVVFPEEVEFECDFDPESCQLKITYGDDCKLVDLGVILDKTKDSLEFDSENCVLTYTNTLGVTTGIFNLAAVLEKVAVNMSWDDENCILVYTGQDGVPQVLNLGEAILSKIGTAISFDIDTCVLTAVGPDGNLQTLADIGAAILGKMQDGAVFDPAECKLTVTNTDGTEDCFDLSVILDKVKVDLDFDPETCILKFTNQACECLDFDLTALLDKIVFPPDVVTTLVDNGGSFTYTNELGDPVTVEFCPICPEVIGAGDINVTASLGPDGQVIYTVEYNEAAPIVTTLVDNGAGSFTYTNELGEPVTVEFCPICPEVVGAGDVVVTSSTGPDGQIIYQVAYEETVTTLVDNGGSFTYVNEEGVPVTVEFCPVCPEVIGAGDINVTSAVGPNGEVIYTVGYNETAPVVTTLVNNGNGSFTYTNEDGIPVTVEFCPVCPVVVGAGDINVSSAVAADGTVTYTVDFTETLTVLEDNGESFTYLNEAGELVTVDKCCTNVSEDADFFYVTDHNGNIAKICKNPVKDVVFNGVAYQPDASGSVVINYEAPEQVLSNVSVNPEGVGGGTGTATITQSDGTVKDDAVCGVQSTVVSNDDGTATITQNDGSIKNDVVCGVQSTVTDNGDNTGSMVQNDGTVCDFQKPITDKNGNPVTSVLTADNFPYVNRPMQPSEQIFGLNINGDCRSFDAPVRAFRCGPDDENIALESSDSIITLDNIVPDAQYALLTNTDGCTVEEGVVIGKRADGKLVSQPPRCAKRYLQAGPSGIFQFQGDAFDALGAASDGSYIGLVEICTTVENDECYPVLCSGDVRVAVSVGIRDAHQLEWLLAPQSGAYSGNGWASACQNAGDPYCVHRKMINEYIVPHILQPGQSITHCVQLQVRFKSTTTGTGNAGIEYNGLRQHIICTPFDCVRTSQQTNEENYSVLYP